MKNQKFSQLLIKEYSNENSLPFDSYSPHSNQAVWWKCEKCTHKWKTKITHRSNGSGCPKCANERRMATRNAKLTAIQHTHPKIASELVDTNKLITFGSNIYCDWKCSKCKMVFQTSPNARCQSNRGCPYCSGRYPTSENNLLAKRPDLASELNDTSLAEKILCYSNKIVQWKCGACNGIWNATPNNRAKGRGCPYCAVKNSKPQREITQILEQLEISFNKEYRISECKDKRSLPFDFSVNSPFGLIEYQGEQHYFPIWGHKNLTKIQSHDEIKRLYCLENSIPLLIIPYWDKNKLPGVIENFIASL